MAENSQIGVWGGRSVAVISLSDLLKGVNAKEYTFDNWITTAIFAYSDASIMYALTAHNVVLHVQSSSGKINKKYTCDEKSILYSGSLKPLANGKDVMVASGTVLGGVVIWDMTSGTIKHNFTSHEGSIFGLAFSSDSQKLISCSDDRSIRLWDLSTGAHLATGWGHLARIWDLHFYENDQIISVSEDCTARIWKISGDALETSEVFDGHIGRNVWCGAINAESHILATGGGDGRIRLWDLERKDQLEKSREYLSLEDTQKDIPTPLAKSEVFKNYTQLDGNMVVATSEGRVIVLDKTMMYREVKLSDQKVDTYLIVKGWDEIRVAAIASRDGQVYLLHTSVEDKVQIIHNDLQAKLTDILVWSFKSKYYVLAQSQNPKDPFIVTRLGLQEGILTQEEQFKLEPPSAFLSTSAALLNESTLFLGSRHGGIVVYDLVSSTSPVNCWRHVASSSDSVTSLIFKSNALHFTTRGGQFAVALIDRNDQEFMLSIVSSNKLQRGSIEGSIFANGQKLLYGFRNDLFFIWNETKQYEIANEKCGGPHRAWQLTLNESSESHYRLIYTKASKVILLSSDCLANKFNSTLLQDGTHGREIRDIAFSPINYPFGRVVATASEDTCINLACIGIDSTLQTHCTLRKHISGLQKLRWSQDGTYLYSSAAREEFVVWKISLTADNNVFATPVASLPTSSDNPDLRIMNFSVTPVSKTFSLIVTVYSDSAIRIWVLDHDKLCFTQIGNGYYRTCCILNADLVVLGLAAHLLISSTDGHLVSWDISKLLERAGISISNSQLKSDAPSDIEPTTLPKPSFSLQLHQSSVKDSILYGPYDGTYYHISGGDDNAIALAKIDLTQITGEKIFSIPSAHSSTITGISKIETGDDSYSFVTVGVDQNVKLWSVLKTNDQWTSIKLLDERYTTVADTGALDVASFEENKAGIMIGGSGLSFWTVK